MERLATRYSGGRFQIKVEGRWRQNRRWPETCFSCYRQGNRVVLQYFAWPDPGGDGDNFKARCPVCGWESITYWVGKPRESGDNGHGWLRARRANSHY